MDSLDLMDLNALLSDDERAVQQSVRRFVDDLVAPVVAQHYADGTFPDDLIPRFAELGLLGASIEGYGCAGMNPLSYWLALKELDRADAGIRSFVSVQGSLVMYPIARYGSEAQKQRFLPAMARGEIVGCFGLTEPDAGSDPGAMHTTAVRVDGGYRVTGTKRWITNGTKADVALIWARTKGEDNTVDGADGVDGVDAIAKKKGTIRGFLVEKGSPGFVAHKIDRKQSFRCSDTAELVLDDVFVPDDLVLADAFGLKAPLSCLHEARGGIAMAVLGSAEASFMCALDFAKNRVTFGKPIAARQLVQQKFSEMATALTLAQLLALQLARIKEQGKHTGVQVSMAKMNNVRTALNVCRTCRDILGANGITDEYPVMRHMNNLETVYTYEGTNDVHLLVIGQHLTGEDAFR